MKTKFKIPKKFKVFNETINILFKDDLRHRNDQFGSAHHRYNEIFIDKSLLQNQEIAWSTFLHEMIHIILGKMEQWELSKDEKFVHILSQLINQAFETME